MKQKEAKLPNFIPLFMSEAGCCLTLENWKSIGIDTLSYPLEALLMKPGLSFLKTLTDLRSYVGWQGTIVLNALLPSSTKAGSFTIRSQYDGAVVKISSDELLDLVVQLQPDYVLLPSGLKQNVSRLLPQTIRFFVSASEPPSNLAESAWGCYFYYDETTKFSDFKYQIKQNKTKPSYVLGELNKEQCRQLINEGILHIETDKPVKDAMIGQMYNSTQDLALLDQNVPFQYQPIEDGCSCPTCTQQLTQAYLHHLLTQTPLLCQRFLIQHNVFFLKHYFSLSERR